MFVENDYLDEAELYLLEKDHSLISYCTIKELKYALTQDLNKPLKIKLQAELNNRIWKYT